MSLAEKMLEAFNTAILMNERLKGVASTVAGQQQKLENLTERIVRLETALEIGLSKARTMRAEKRQRQIENKD